MEYKTDWFGCLLALVAVVFVATVALILVMAPFILAAKFWSWIV